MQYKFYIDYDIHPDLGGQQGVFMIGAGEFADLIGCRIVEIKPKEDDPYTLAITVEKDEDPPQSA